MYKKYLTKQVFIANSIFKENEVFIGKKKIKKIKTRLL
jgi:hypothetical protein